MGMGMVLWWTMGIPVALGELDLGMHRLYVAAGVVLVWKAV